MSMKTSLYYIGGAIVLLSLVLCAGFFYANTAPMQHSTLMLPTRQVTIGTDSTSSPQVTITAEIASTDPERVQGLSGRTSLLPNYGMLFIFDQPGNYGFWMKDMNFSLDMLFADTQGKVVTIAADATPESYRQNPPQVFYPSAPILYVLEVPAGFAAAHNIRQGDTLVVQ